MQEDNFCVPVKAVNLTGILFQGTSCTVISKFALGRLQVSQIKSLYIQIKAVSATGFFSINKLYRQFKCCTFDLPAFSIKKFYVPFKAVKLTGILFQSTRRIVT